MDSDNPVVKLCIDGMRAKGEGREQEARVLFSRAWDSRTDDYEACVAAHYLAQAQESAESKLHWNEEALRRADGVSSERIGELYPSLFVNLARSWEDVGDADQARRYYELALTRLAEVSAGSVDEHVRESIMQALARLV